MREPKTSAEFVFAPVAAAGCSRTETFGSGPEPSTAVESPSAAAVEYLLTTLNFGHKKNNLDMFFVIILSDSYF